MQSGGGVAVGWTLAVFDVNNNAIAYQNISTPSSGGWTYQSSTYTVPSNGAYVFLYAQINTGSGTTVLLADDGFLSSGTRYYHQDHLSNRLVTSASGNVIEQLGHFPFGESWYNTSGDKLLFTSYERDAESGNDYAQARYYASRLGRFLSLDALSGDASDPQSLNRYVYVRNYPVASSDPTGLDPEEDGNSQVSASGDSSSILSILPLIEYLDQLFEYFQALSSAPQTITVTASPIDVSTSDWSIIGGDSFGGQGSGISAGGGCPMGICISLPKVAPKIPCAVTPDSLNAYLQHVHSPMTGQGQAFWDAGQKFDVDPRLTIALAGAETTFGKNITWGQYNAWNFGWNVQNRSNSPFSSWGSGITSVTRALGKNYLGQGLWNVDTVYAKYCVGPGCVDGLNNLTQSLKQQSPPGNPRNLGFPCK